MTWVSESSSQCSSRSLPETSALLPIETNWVRPMPSERATLRMATPRAPDWLTKPTPPRSAGTGAKVALSEIAGSVLMIPMQLGPIMRTPARRTVSRSRASRSRPSSPTSAKPAVITTRPRTPLAMDSSTAAWTWRRGTTMTARSTGSGIAPIEG